MEENISKLCLFCASTCIPPRAQVVPPSPVKSEVFITPDLDRLPASTPHQPEEEIQEPTLSFEGDVPSLQSNLKGVFILQKILKLPQSSLIKLLSQNDGDFRPERWTNACEYCSVFLWKHQKTLKEIAKLERILTEIEIELKERIVSSKDNLEGNSDWVQIRREVLNDYLSATEATSTVLPAKCDPDPATETFNTDYHPLFDEEPAPSHQEDYDDVPIDEEFKIFVENLYGDGKNTPNNLNVNVNNSHSQPDEDQIIPPPPTIPDLVLTTAPPSTPEDAPMEQDQDVSRKVGAPTKRKRKPRLNCSISRSIRQRFGHLSSYILTQESSSRTRFIICTKCPYKTKRWSYFDIHSKAHEEGSGGRPCEHCGIFLLPNKMAHHEGLLHNEYRKSKNDSTISLDKDKTQPNRRWWYYCAKCPFSCSQRQDFKKHEKVHEPGANPVICGDCGVYLLPNKLAYHQGRYHVKSSEKEERIKILRELRRQKEKELTSSSSSSGSKGYNCDKCPFSGSCRKLLIRHEKVHAPGSNAVACEVCGWLMMPRVLAQHQGRMHLQVWQQKTNKRRIKAFLKEHAELTSGSEITQEVVVVNGGDVASASTKKTSSIHVLNKKKMKSQEIGFNQAFSKTLQEFGISPPTLNSQDSIQVSTRSRSRSASQNHLNVSTKSSPSPFIFK